MIPLLDLQAQYHLIKAEIDAAVGEVMSSANFVLGKSVSNLELNISQFVGTNHAVGVANGTDALVLCLKAMGIGQGDEVITTPFTFFATAESICEVGATPVFVDIDERNYNLRPDLVAKAVTSRTKAIMPVHIFGQPADMDELSKIAEQHGLKIIEDACQAIGAKYKGRPIGSLGDAAAFSFFPSKNLGGAGDGGMVTTNDPDVASTIRLLRQHGSEKKYFHKILGCNSRLDALQAAILNVKLEHLSDWNRRRKELAHKYNELLSDLPFETPFEESDVDHVYHLYILRSKCRDAVSDHLTSMGIGNGVYYPLCLHLQEALKFLGYKQGDLTVAEAASLETFAIPLFPEMTDSQMEQVVAALRSAPSA